MDMFTVDVCLPESWLLAALERSRAGKSVRVTFVVADSGPNTKTKVAVQPGRSDDFLVGRMAGDFTTDEIWKA